jgi:threonine synthase
VASTGNAGSSLAGLAASMGIPAAIFVPASAPRGKLIPALLSGAEVFAVQGGSVRFLMSQCAGLTVATSIDSLVLLR